MEDETRYVVIEIPEKLVDTNDPWLVHLITPSKVEAIATWLDKTNSGKAVEVFKADRWNILL